MNIIALCGAASSGKSTAAAHLITHGYQLISFADILKDVVSVMFDWPRELLNGDTLESREWREQRDDWWSAELGRDITPRYILQNFGTDCVRMHFHSDFWLIVLKRKMKENTKYVISDVRFDNEYNYLRSINAIIIRISREDVSQFTEFIHISETRYQHFDAIDVTNNSSIEDLCTKIELLSS